MREKCLMLSLFCVFCFGCTVSYEQREVIEDPAPQIKRLVSTYQLRYGLTRAEVLALLGEQVTIGYEMPDTREKRYMPVMIKNPRRVENYHSGSRTYSIEYYFTGIDQIDDEITDNELTPIVFEGNKLVGWGWIFLNKIKERK